jgi:signal peptidase I
LIRDYYSEIFAVQSASMAPSLRKGDLIVIHKFSVFNRLTVNSLQRGQRVLFTAPQDGRLYIKRIIGLPGDSIDYRSGALTINQQAVPQTELSGNQQGDTIYRQQLDRINYPILRTRNGRSPAAKLVVPEDEVFVLGDNRDNSHDSRHFGTVKKEALKGLILP